MDAHDKLASCCEFANFKNALGLALLFMFLVSNGYRPTETRPKPLENSTPTGRLKQEFPLNVDDMGGLISPLREDVFNGTSTTANDVNFSVLPHDPSLMGATFSSSVDTIGSYCDGKHQVIMEASHF